MSITVCFSLNLPKVYEIPWTPTLHGSIILARYLAFSALLSFCKDPLKILLNSEGMANFELLYCYYTPRQNIF